MTLLLLAGPYGLRVYASWDDIPPRAHAELRPGTQNLKPAYDSALRGREVTGTMIALLRFYAQTAPDIVHRDHRGEWTGFPLMSQPGVTSPLHPEEPSSITDAWGWLTGRAPGGDSRLICGQHTVKSTSYVFGHTFLGQLSFTPFVESVEQANRDIESGYTYLAGDVSENVEDVSAQFPRARQGAVLASRGDLDSWAFSVPRIEPAGDWCADAHAELWQRMVRLEREGLIPEANAYELYRARRLNALVPSGA